MVSADDPGKRARVWVVQPYHGEADVCDTEAYARMLDVIVVGMGTKLPWHTKMDGNIADMASRESPNS
jgi:hypothetical protein